MTAQQAYNGAATAAAGAQGERLAMLLARKRSLVGLWVADNASDPADGTFALAEVIDVLDADGTSLAMIRYEATGLIMLAEVSGLFELGLGVFRTRDEAQAAIADWQPEGEPTGATVRGYLVPGRGGAA